MCGTIPPNMTPEQAEAFLRKWLSSRVIDLRVLLRAGGIALQGTAYSYYAKQLAQHGAMCIFGLPIVANEIEVRPNASSPGVDASDFV